MSKLFLAIFLFFSAILSWDAKACLWPGSKFVSASLIPIKTTAAKGPNSFSNPLIGVRIERCSFFKTYYYDFTFKPGDIKSPGDPFAYQYFARIATNENVCKNQCVYGASCQTPPKGCASNFRPASNCDPQLTALTITMCGDAFGAKRKGTSVGICLYQSAHNKASQFFVNFFSSLLDSIKKAASGTWTIPAVALYDAFSAGASDEMDKNNFTPLGCFPVPMAQLPPPFCQGPLVESSDIKVLRICGEGEEPWRTLLGDTQECVISETVKSSFFNPCVRVTYEKHTKGTATDGQATDENVAPPFSLKNNYYTTTNKEALYISDPKADSSKQILPLNAQIRYANIYDQQNSTPVTNPPLKPWGYNDAPYTDICGSIDPTSGVISTNGTNTLIDGGNTRTFSLDILCPDPSCIDPKTGEQICTTLLPCTTPSARFQTNQIYVMEKQASGETVAVDSVQRPGMKKPTVNFCKNDSGNYIINDKDQSCMEATIIESSKRYEFRGDTTHCTDVPTKDAKPLCTLPNNNPFGFAAILTNRNYINALTIEQRGEVNKCYPNQDLTENPNKNLPPNPLPRPGPCSSSAPEFGIYDTGSGIYDKTVVGAERLCLHGYTNSPYSSMAEPWCKGSACNRVCAVPIVEPTDPNSPLKIPPTDVANRIIPSPAQSGYPTESCPYSRPSSPPKVSYRPFNPIEDDLCVDAYTIAFNKNCAGLEAPALCTKVRDFCSIPTNSKNHYKNFDLCQNLFQNCLTKPTPTGQKQLGGIELEIPFICNDVLKFVY